MKPRVMSCLNFDWNEHQRKCFFAYSGTPWLGSVLRPGQRAATDDLTAAFPHLALHGDSRAEQQIYRDPATGQWRVLVNCGFGAQVSPFFCTQHSSELVAGVKGEAGRALWRWTRLYRAWRARHPEEGPLLAPYLVCWREDGGTAGVYVDDIINTSLDRRVARSAGRAPGIIVIGRHVQDHVKMRCRGVRWRIAEKKSTGPSRIPCPAAPRASSSGPGRKRSPASHGHSAATACTTAALKHERNA